MSADNWAYCPRCLTSRKKSIADLEIELLKAYGEVDLATFKEIERKLSLLKTSDLDRTLREDWNLGIDANGEFTVSYRAQCADCPFEFNFDHREDILL